VTRVCLVGSPDVTLRYELLSRETSREALATYDLTRPFANSIGLRTVSLGAAVSLCNDLQWYLVRFVDRVLIQEPSVSDTEWLSRDLATDIRNGVHEPEDTGEHLLVYGLVSPDAGASDSADEQRPARASSPATATAGAQTTPSGTDSSDAQAAPTPEDRPALVDPLYVRRTDGEIPEYDLRDVEETLVVRLTAAEFSA